MTALVYIHGFNSSPRSAKARQTRRWLTAHGAEVAFYCPALSPFAGEAVFALEQLTQRLLSQDRSVWLAGSSMGGFFATWLAEKYNLPAVLINPAVRPHERMPQWLGENRNFHTGEIYQLLPEHVEEYRHYDIATLKFPGNYLCLLQVGDEVLDYRQAEEKYRGGQLVIEAGGDHSFQGYERHLPTMIEFYRRSVSNRGPEAR